MESPIVRHFLVCLGMHYDWSEPDAPYSLQNVVFGYHLPSGTSFPFVMNELWLFALLDGAGTSGG